MVLWHTYGETSSVVPSCMLYTAQTQQPVVTSKRLQTLTTLRSHQGNWHMTHTQKGHLDIITYSVSPHITKHFTQPVSQPVFYCPEITARPVQVPTTEESVKSKLFCCKYSNEKKCMTNEYQRCTKTILLVICKT